MSSKLGWVTVAASIGSLADWYDYFISASAAALAWPAVFYSFNDPAVAFALSIGTYAVTFLTRPIGAMIFGHFGDKVGRKEVLVWVLVLGSISTFGIGCTPSYASIGVAAPALIILFRAMFGLGLGGEFGGASTWVVEEGSKSKRRGFLSGATLSILNVGSASGALTYSILTAILDRSSFLAWGWRVPFYIGTLLLVVGVVIRWRLAESSLFLSKVKEAKRIRYPLKEVLTKYWRKWIPLSFQTNFAGGVNNTILVSFSLGYAVAAGSNNSFMLFALTLAGASATFAAFLGAYASDKIGRRPVAAASPILVIIFIAPFFLLLGTGVPMYILLGVLILAAQSVGQGPAPALFTEQYPTEVRYTGSGVSYGIGNLLAGIVTALLIPSLVISAGSILKSWPYVAATLIIINILALIGLYFIKETKKADLETLELA
jgi:MFS family permease